MTVKDRSAFEAMTALRALRQYDDFDPAVYFDMAARQLLGSHGPRAIILADAAVVKMRALGDHEACELWEEVRAAILDFCDEDETDIPAPRYATLH